MVEKTYADTIGFQSNEILGQGTLVPGTDLDMDHTAAVLYVCGKCGKDNKLDGEAVIKCISCGGRIFYKKRERKLI